MNTPRVSVGPTLLCSLALILSAPPRAASGTNTPKAESAAQLWCEGFQEGTVSDPYSGFSGVNEILSIGTPGPSNPTDKYLNCHDGSGGSYVVCSSRFTGDYTSLPYSTGLAFDARLIDDGQSGHLVMHPWIQLNSGGLWAHFVASNAQVLTEDGGSSPGWHHIQVPYGTLRDGTLTDALGTWTISSGVASDGAVILANVTRTDLSGFDLGGGPYEIGGYDNVCVTTCISPYWQQEAITQGPISQTFVNGQDVHFSVTTGPDVTSVQWVRLDPTQVNLSDDSYYSGTTTNTLTAYSSYCAVGSYACVVTTSCGTVQSATATLTCTDLPQILQQPADKVAVIGTNVTFAIGIPPFFPLCNGNTYHWYNVTKQIALVDNPPHITGTSTATLHIDQVGGPDIGDYACDITNVCGDVFTRNAHLLVISGPGVVPAYEPWQLALLAGFLVVFGSVVLRRRSLAAGASPQSGAGSFRH